MTPHFPRLWLHVQHVFADAFWLLLLLLATALLVGGFVSSVR